MARTIQDRLRKSRKPNLSNQKRRFDPLLSVPREETRLDIHHMSLFMPDLVPEDSLSTGTSGLQSPLGLRAVLCMKQLGKTRADDFLGHATQHGSRLGRSVEDNAGGGELGPKIVLGEGACSAGFQAGHRTQAIHGSFASHENEERSSTTPFDVPGAVGLEPDVSAVLLADAVCHAHRGRVDAGPKVAKDGANVAGMADVR